MKTEFQKDACRALAEFAEKNQLTGYLLVESGNGTEFKNYLNDTVFTVYHKRLDEHNRGRIEIAVGVENISRELSIKSEAVEHWLAATQATLPSAEKKAPKQWPRLAVWSHADVQRFCDAFEFLSQKQGGSPYWSALVPQRTPPLDERLTRAILSRRGQARFRSALLDAYAERCAISGCTDISVLEAAHIVPHSHQQQRGQVHLIGLCKKKKGQVGSPLISRTPENEDNPRMEVCDGKASTIHRGVQTRSDPVDEDGEQACCSACT